MHKVLPTVGELLHVFHRFSVTRGRERKAMHFQCFHLYWLYVLHVMVPRDRIKST